LSVPFLRDEHFDDYSTVSDATISSLKGLKEKSNKVFKYVIQLMPNCPLRGSHEIKLAWSNFVKNEFDFQISAFKFGWMNPWWAATVSKNGQPNYIFDGSNSKRSQDLPELYCPTGAIWIARVDKLIEQGSFYGDGHRFFEMNWKSAADIDDFDDFQFAELIAKQLKATPFDKNIDRKN